MQKTTTENLFRMKLEIPWRTWAPISGVALLVFLALWMVIAPLGDIRSQEKLAVAKTIFEEQTGIRVLRIVLTAGGGILDLQYQVVDPDKALILHDADNPPMMLDEKNNLIFANPFHEHGAREVHTAVTYHGLIMNGGGLIQRGSKITLRVGDAILEHLVVK